MRYWLLKADTPYCGETAYEYIEAETYEQAEIQGEELMYDNANEWYDEEVAEEYDWGEYLTSCDFSVEEITYDEYVRYKE